MSNRLERLALLNLASSYSQVYETEEQRRLQALRKQFEEKFLRPLLEKMIEQGTLPKPESKPEITWDNWEI